MTTEKFLIAQPQGHYFNREFVTVQGLKLEPHGKFTVVSPADSQDVIGSWDFSYSLVDQVIESAQDGFKVWKKLKLEERIQYLKNYQEILLKNADLFAHTISREVGKPLWESKTEFQSMVNKIDITIQQSLRFVESHRFEKITARADGYYEYRPLGVMVVVGPFNFPGHLPNGHIVPALLTGNAVIFKPSEKTPLTGQLLAQCLHEAGLPRGVFSCLQGDRELSRRLVVHEGIDGVLFTGSYEVGLRIKQDTLTQHWKLLALEMGGKNPTIVFDDASLDYSVRESLISSYITTGQRCSATSRILVQDAIYDRFVEKFHALAKGFKIGQPLTQPFMGPLIDQSSVDRYMKVIGIASREGFELLMRGKSLRENYVTPTIALSEELTLDKVKKSYVLQNEIFGPFVTIERFSSSEKAIESANCNSYGLVASVFTQNQKRYEEVFSELNYGLINWNQATIGASSQLPFGGIKKSGNHRPTALTSSLYTTYPVACLEVHDTSKENTKVQGLDETKTS